MFYLTSCYEGFPRASHNLVRMNSCLAWIASTFFFKNGGGGANKTFVIILLDNNTTSQREQNAITMVNASHQSSPLECAPYITTTNTRTVDTPIVDDVPLALVEWGSPTVSSYGGEDPPGGGPEDDVRFYSTSSSGLRTNITTTTATTTTSTDPNRAKWRRNLRWAVTALALLAAAALTTSVVLTTNKNKNSTTNNGDVNSSSINDDNKKQDPNEYLLQIQQVLLGNYKNKNGGSTSTSNVTTSSNPVMSSSPSSLLSSHSRQATEWLAFEDTLFLPPDSPQFIERYALLVLMFASGGNRIGSGIHSWSTRTGAALHHCDWEHVACRTDYKNNDNKSNKNNNDNNNTGDDGAQQEQQQLVTSLNLGAKGALSGTIPVEIGYLTNLIALSLAGNRFEGSLPEELWGLTNLGACLHACECICVCGGGGCYGTHHCTCC